ncbi:MAG: ABC transporter permease [Methanomassiliicoccales archaeon]|nr:MAG: ABC transporter permease [Methanomassiliicoccales archaeon]
MDPILIAFLTLFSLILLWIIISSIRNRVLFKMALRNFLRKKSSTVIIIVGLMVGTAIISSSFTVGDSFNTLLASDIVDELQGTDEVYVFRIPGRQETLDFPIDIYYELAAEIGDDDSIDGMEPELRKDVNILNIDKTLVEPRVMVAGIIFNHSDEFGNLYINGDKVDSIPDDFVLINKELAEELDADPGDRLKLTYLNRTGNFTVQGVLDLKERGYSSVELYLNLEDLQVLLGLEDKINRIHISNRGDILTGMENADDVKDLVDNANISYEGFSPYLLRDKKAEYDRVFEEGFFFADLLLIFGSFTIIASVILIINIFIMLGEERRSEMGMTRAIGMNKLELRRLFVYEGSLYAGIASLIGSVFGVVVAFFIIWSIGNAFTGGNSSDILRAFTFTIDSLILAFCLGFIISILTIYYATRKISEVNIIRAVRNLPEPVIPRKDKKTLKIGIIMVFLAVLIILFSLVPIFDGLDNDENGKIDDSEEGSATSLFSGFSILFFGLPFFLRRVIKDKWAFSAGAVMVIALWSIPFDKMLGLSEDFFTFALAGILMVTATVSLLMVNSNAVVRFFEKIFASVGCCLAVSHTALSYSLNSKFRTGLTIAMFSLVIFIITFMSILLAIVGGNLEAQIDETSGGFDIMVKMSEPVEDFEIEYNNTESVDLVEDYFALKNTEITFNRYSLILDSDQVDYPVIGIDDHFIDQNRFKVSRLITDFNGDPTAAFEAMKQNSEYVLADSSTAGAGFGPPPLLPLELGETLQVTLKDGLKRNLTIIGFIDTFVTFIDPDKSLNGIFIYDKFLVENYNATGVGTVLFKLKDRDNNLAVRQDMERTFLAYGAQSVDFKKEAEAQIEANVSFFNILNGYLGLGLIVGIAGLGIITLRSVNERRNQIGMMRAIGFNKRQVQVAFIIESTYISFLGIMIGVIIGLVVSANLFFKLFEAQDYEFILPIGSISVIILITLGMTLFSTLPPSTMASRIAPAEVLRYE